METDDVRRAIVSVSRNQWQLQYEGNAWDYLRDIEEVAHYAVVAGLIVHAAAKILLDVGCGEGILLTYLRAYPYVRYVGIDVSTAALSKTERLIDSRTEFIAADVERFCPRGSCDGLIFNECLYYFADPIAVIDNYRSTLTADGVIVTSLYLCNKRIRELAIQLTRTYHCQENVTVSNRHGAWMCSLLSNRRI